jgi:hypothetical protein
MKPVQLQLQQAMETLADLRDTLAHEGYCPVCDRHAPRDPETAALAGDIPHEDGCPFRAAEVLLDQWRARTVKRAGERAKFTD